MYELVKITEHNYYINCPTKVGIYECAPGEVWLIDGGSDKDAGRKIWKHLTENGWTLRGIIITHSNADHTGGCRLLCDRAGCLAWATPMEAAVTENPVLESTILFGAYPPSPLRGKFLMAPACPCGDIAAAPLPEGLRIVPLPGHFLDMIGIITPEGVFFCADAVFSETVVNKYHVNFVYDVRLAMETLAGLAGQDARWFLPAHAELTEDIAPLAELNLSKMREIISVIKELCASPLTFEELLKGVFDRFGLEMNFSQYALVGSSVRSYLAYLLDEHLLKAEFLDNRMIWREN